MSKFKRARKYIGKTIAYLPIWGNHHYEVVDVVYIEPNSDIIRLSMATNKGLHFKGKILGAPNNTLQTLQKALDYRREKLKDFYTMKENGAIYTGYQKLEDIILGTEKHMEELEEQINHPDINYTFLKVNSRCRHQVIK